MHGPGPRNTGFRTRLPLRTLPLLTMAGAAFIAALAGMAAPARAQGKRDAKK